jgi:hypothetical protein
VQRLARTLFSVNPSSLTDVTILVVSALALWRVPLIDQI